MDLCKCVFGSAWSSLILLAVPALQNPCFSLDLSLHLYFAGLVGGKVRREQERPLQSRVLGTHFPWQLMMKHAMWMAFQHRRERAGAAPAVPQSGGEVALDAAELDSGSEDVRSDGQQDTDDCDESQSSAESDQEALRAGPHARAYVLACIMPCSGPCAEVSTGGTRNAIPVFCRYAIANAAKLVGT
jgi:hypothetical protein